MLLQRSNSVVLALIFFTAVQCQCIFDSYPSNLIESIVQPVGKDKLIIERAIFTYNLTAYTDWSDWSGCKPEERCIRVRYRSCKDDSYEKNMPDYKLASGCPVKYVVEREACQGNELTECQDKIKDMFRRVDSLLENCGVRGNDKTDKIAGGKTATANSWPWHVGMYLSNYAQGAAKEPFCGATMISDRHAITAAHCLSKSLDPAGVVPNTWHNISAFSDIYLWVKINDHNLKKKDVSEQSINIEKFIIHPKYDDKSIRAVDLAIMKLSDPVKTDEFMYACLPKPEQTTPVGTKCFAVGWGFTGSGHSSLSTRFDGMNHLEEIFSQIFNKPYYNSLRRRPSGRGRGRGLSKRPSELQEVELPIVDMKFCSRIFSKLKNSTHICAGRTGKDTCEADSGGGLFCKNEDDTWYQYGVTSFGSSKGCGLHPGVYTSVSGAIDWIRETLVQDSWTD